MNEDKKRKSSKGIPKWHVTTKDGNIEPLKPYKFIRDPKNPYVRLIPITLQAVLESDKWKDFYDKNYKDKNFIYIDDKEYTKLKNQERGITIKIKRPINNETKKKTPSPNVVLKKKKKKVVIKEPEKPVQENPKPKLKKKLVIVNELVDKSKYKFDKNYLDYLYPNVNDENFMTKLSSHKEFDNTKYDGNVYKIKDRSDELCESEFELMPHQKFVKNLLSFNTPYNSLLLFHGLGTGKTCSAIGICEEMRLYMKQVGSKRPIIVVAAPNVQDNFRLQLFDERKLVYKNDEWNLNTCVGANLLREINPTQIKNVTKKKIVDQINSIIRTNYLFFGYTQFANYISNKTKIGLNMKYTAEDKERIKKKKIKKYFDNCLIVIDEVHNLRITGDNTGSNKKTAELLMEVAKDSDNMRMLLLSATPMYNSYEEIIWLINLMSINDGKNTLKTSDIFDSNGNFQKGKNKGQELLIRKLNGYVSYVRGENPYLFPHRLYAKNESLLSTIIPTKQLNNMKIDSNLEFLPLYYTEIGSYQKDVYEFIIKNKKAAKDELFSTSVKNKKLFENLDSFGYELLQKPIECLNICFPNDLINFNKLPKDVTEQNSLINTLVGKSGLSNVMKYKTTIKEKIKYNFEYINPKEQIFHLENLHKYSAKIYNICNIIKRSKGIILIYSQFIDGGALPMALALEEMGFTRYCSDPNVKSLLKNPPDPIDAITMKTDIEFEAEIQNAKDLYEEAEQDLENYKEACDNGEELEENCEEVIQDLTDNRDKYADNYNEMKSVFNTAKYIIVSGDKSYSPNNDADIKYLNQSSNKNGGKVKVVIISMAGSEGIDYKNVRQVHILEPWYNMNRIEQIIGRGVRSMSHCLLPFEQRNTEIFLHATVSYNEKECADRYVYRVAEKKSIKIGKVTRLIKENAVDCLLNIGQTNFTKEILSSIPENENIEIEYPSGELKQISMGDMPYSNICDYMESCDYKCNGKDVDEINNATNNKLFITNNEMIIKKIKNLFLDIPGEKKGKFYYKLDELIESVNIRSNYSLEQIYFAIEELLNGNEKIYDKYDRPGKLVSKGDYYMFQPLEITDENASIYERSNPVHVKHTEIHVRIPEIVKGEEKIEIKTTNLISTITDKMKIAFDNKAVKDKTLLFYSCFPTIAEHLKSTYNISKKNIEKMVMSHIVDSILNEEKLKLLEYIYKDDWEAQNEYEILMKYYFDEKMLMTDSGTEMAIALEINGKLEIFIFSDNTWSTGEFTDNKKFFDTASFKEKYLVTNINSKLNDVYGFFETVKGETEKVFKIRDLSDKVNKKGARVLQMQNKDIITKINKIISEENRYTLENIDGLLDTISKDSRMKYSILLEMLMRNNDMNSEKKWLLSQEQIKINKINDYRKN